MGKKHGTYSGNLWKRNAEKVELSWALEALAFEHVRMKEAMWIFVLTYKNPWFP